MQSKNPDGKSQWEIILKPGEEKKLAYQYTCLELFLPVLFMY